MHRYYTGVDGVRFIAAMMVAAIHLGFAPWQYPLSKVAGIVGGTGVPPDSWNWARFGWVGVEVFFVISGLVIANSSRRATPMEFAFGRILRLYPAAWVCATLSLIVIVACVRTRGALTMLEYLGSLLLSPIGPYIDPVYWTLGVEMVFYGLIMVWLLRGRSVRLELLAIGLAAWSGAYLVLLASGVLELPRLIERLALLRHGSFFACGIFLWLLAERQLSRAGHLMLWASMVFGALELAIQSRSLQVVAHVPILIWLLCVALVWLSTKPRNPVPGAGILRTAGLMTYPVYLCHCTVGGITLRWMLQAGADPAHAVTVGLLVTAAVSYLICRVIEPPLREATRRGLKRLESRYFVGQDRWALLYRAS